MVKQLLKNLWWLPAYALLATASFAAVDGGGGGVTPPPGGGGGGSGTVTSSGSPVSGNIAAFTTATNIAPATAAQIVGTFSGCSGTQYLGADGACHNIPSGSGTVTSFTDNSGLFTVATATTTPTTTYANAAANTVFGNNTGSAAAPGFQTSINITGSSTTGTSDTISTSANCMSVGPNGVTNPSLNVDCSTASAVTGLNLKASAPGGGTSLTVLSSGTNESFTLNSKGTGSQSYSIPTVGGSFTYSIGGSIMEQINNNTILARREFSMGGTAPGIAGGTGAGTGPTIALAGFMPAQQITVTTGTTPAGTGATIFTLTYPVAFSTGSVVQCSPANPAAALLSGVTMVYSAGNASQGFLFAPATALTAATAYVWTCSEWGY